MSLLNSLIGPATQILDKFVEDIVTQSRRNIYFVVPVRSITKVVAVLSILQSQIEKAKDDDLNQE